MRRSTLLLALLLLLPLAGCGAAAEPAGGAFLAANAASVVVFGRAIPDLAVSLVSGRDCSIVHWDEGRPYCTPREPEPPPQPYCTATLGVPECWASRSMFADPPPGLASTPQMTAAQEANRTARWPQF